MTYEIPNPKEEPIKAIVLYFKVLSGTEFDDRSWDKVHFGRCMRGAKLLLEVCGTFEIAKRCLEDLSEKFGELGISWTLETVVKHSHEWKQRRGKNNDKQIRARFFDALALQRTIDENKKQGKLTSAGEILATIRDFEVLQSGIGYEGSDGDSTDGSPGNPIQRHRVEEKEA